MYFKRMQESNPIKAPGSNAFPTGGIIKEAWQISTTYFWPLTLAIFLIQIPETILVSLANDNQAWKISCLYDALVSGFVFVGAYRTVFRLKSTGVPPTFGDIFREGQPFYGRNFRLIWLSGIFTAIVVLGVVIIILPCLALLRDGRNEPWSYALLATSIVIGTAMISWWAARLFFYRAALSDDATGAMKAIEESFRLTKGKVMTVAPLLISMLGILMVFFISYMETLVTVAGGFENEISKGTEVKIDLIFAFPFAFMQALGISMAALAYLHLRDESRSTAAAASSAAPEAPLS